MISPHPRATVLALALVVFLWLAPAGAALTGGPYAVAFTLPAGDGFTAVAVGDLRLQGNARGPVMGLNVESARFAAVPEVTVIEQDTDGAPRETRFRNVNVRVHGGDVVWAPPEGDGFLTRGHAAYGALLPMTGLMAETGEGAFLVTLAPDPVFEFQHLLPGDTDLAPVDAAITIEDAATGRPIGGWDNRSVNEDVPLEEAARPGPGRTFLRLSGEFSAEWNAPLTGVSVGPPDSLVNFTVGLTPATTPRFRDTIPLFHGFSRLMGDAAGAPPVAELTRLAAFEDYLNGALLLLEENAAVPVNATIGDEARPLKGFTLLRSADLRITYSPAGEGRVDGTARLAFTDASFVTESHAHALPGIPVLAVVLWVIAAGALAFWFVKRPPEVAAGQTRLRLAGIAAHVGVLLTVFWLWDRAFAGAFGTSLLTLLSRGNLDLMALGTTAGFEFLPWSLGAFAFALPVRIATGVALRHRLPGRPVKGFAKAAGLVVLGVAGPAYALWFLNETLLRYLPGAFGG